MTRYSARERVAISRGQFFTPAELAARPWLGRTVTTDPVQAYRDPNKRPVSAQAVKDAESPGVCSWCQEPGDDRSALVEVNLYGYGEYRHPECATER